MLLPLQKKNYREHRFYLPWLCCSFQRESYSAWITNEEKVVVNGNTKLWRWEKVALTHTEKRDTLTNGNISSFSLRLSVSSLSWVYNATTNHLHHLSTVHMGTCMVVQCGYEVPSCDKMVYSGRKSAPYFLKCRTLVFIIMFDFREFNKWRQK